MSLPLWLVKNYKSLSAYDVVHCHLTFGAIFGNVFWLARHLRNKNLPIIVETNHSIGTNIKLRQKILFYISSIMRDGNVSMAKSNKNTSFGNLSSQNNLFIPNGIDLSRDKLSKEERLAFMEKNNIPSGKLIVGTIGRMVKERNIDALLLTFARIINLMSEEERNKFHIYWGGDGDEKESIVQRLKHAQIHKYFSFPGLIQDPFPAMSIMNIYVTMNVGATTGISGLEAASQGLPVVAIQMLNGYTADENDWIWSSVETDAVADRVLSLIRNELARSALGDFQKKYVHDNLSSGVMANRYIDYYKDLITKVDI